MKLMEEEYKSLKKELLQEQSIKNEVLEKLKSFTSNLEELEKQQRSELDEATEKNQAQIAKFDLLQSDYLACQNEVATLREIKLELEQKLLLTSQESETATNFTQRFESESRKLKETLNAINSQKEEIKQLKCEKEKYLDELAILKKEKRDLEDKFESISSPNESATNLIQQLESEIKQLKETLNAVNSQQEEIEQLKCEKEKYMDELAILKKEKRDLEDKFHSTSSQNGIHELVLTLEKCETEANHKIEELQSNVAQLKEKLETSSVNHEKECVVLHELIAILEKCEALASYKIKKIHSNSSKFVKQIMDLKNSLKSKDTIIDVLNNDIKDIRKNYKDLEASSKKQLQVETRKLNSEIEKMEMRLADFKKLNESLKCDLAKLEAEKDKIENEYKNVKDEATTKTNEIHKEKRSRRTVDQSENIFDESKVKKEIPEIQENKRRNNKKKTIEKSRNVTESKKLKTEIYEETGENSSNENMRNEKRTGRKHLRCLSNIAGDQGIKKEEELSKNRTSKRKTDTSEYKSPEKKILKKSKMLYNLKDAENSNKPQNLRLMLLKSTANVNDIPLPSPRMTRGRKRLVLAKDLPASPRTVRS